MIVRIKQNSRCAVLGTGTFKSKQSYLIIIIRLFLIQYCWPSINLTLKNCRMNHRIHKFPSQILIEFGFVSLM